MTFTFQYALLGLAFFLVHVTASANPLSPPPVNETPKRLKAASLLPVPQPISTPYDKDPVAKKIYLDQFNAGYRTVLAAVTFDCHMGVRGPYLEAFQQGWSDGIKAAKKDHPEKEAEMLGMTLEMFNQIKRQDSLK